MSYTKSYSFVGRFLYFILGFVSGIFFSSTYFLELLK